MDNLKNAMLSGPQFDHLNLGGHCPPIALGTSPKYEYVVLWFSEGDSNAEIERALNARGQDGFRLAKVAHTASIAAGHLIIMER